jgi:hypothetical protein
MGVVLGIALGLAWAARAEADDLKTVSCDGFILSYSGQVENKKCSTEDRENNQGSDTVSQIEIRDSRFYFVATYYKSKLRTYYPYRTPREVAAANSSFSKITGWEDLPDTHGFKVAAFSAVLAGQKGTIFCAVFDRSSGTTTSAAEYDAGPGSKNVLEGYYCPQDGFSSTAPGSASMRALEDRIGRLQVPAE